MKKLLVFIILSLVFYIPAGAQTHIKFIQNTNASLRKAADGNIKGSIEQTGNSFDGLVTIELPSKNLKLDFLPSSIKQYNLLQTSSGEVFTGVEVYASKNINGSYFLVSIRKKVYSILLAEEDSFYELRKESDGIFSYRNMAFDGLNAEILIDEYFPKGQLDFEQNINKKVRETSSYGCYEFPVAFISDYDHYLNNQDKDLGEIEARNLANLAGAQTIWNFYDPFKSEVKFKTIGQIIYTDESAPNANRDPNASMGSNLHGLTEFWKRPEGWYIDYLTIAVITGIHYPYKRELLPGENRNKFVLATGSTFLSKFKTGSILMRGYIDEENLVPSLEVNGGITQYVLAHELGHSFGLSHSSGSASDIMSPYINSSSAFSPGHVDTINIVVEDLASLAAVDPCPKVILSWTDEKDGIKFSWSSFFIGEEDFFELEISSDEGKSWEKTGTKNPLLSNDLELKFLDSEIRQSNFNARIIQKGENYAVSNVVNIDLETLRKIPEKGAVVYFDNALKQVVIKSSKPTGVEVFGIDGKLVGKDYLKYYLLEIKASNWMPGIYLVHLAAFPEERLKVLVY